MSEGEKLLKENKKEVNRDLKKARDDSAQAVHRYLEEDLARSALPFPKSIPADVTLPSHNIDAYLTRISSADDGCKLHSVFFISTDLY